MVLFHVYEIHPSARHWYFLLGASAIIIFYVSAKLCGLYGNWRGTSLADEAGVVIRTWFVAALAILLTGYASKTSTIYSRRVVLTWLIGVPVVLCVWGMLLRRVSVHARARGRNSRAAVVVGVGAAALAAAREIRDLPGTGIRLVGFYDNEAPLGSRPLEGCSVPVKGTLADLVEAVKHDSGIDWVYVALPLSRESEIRSLVDSLADSSVRVFLVPTFFVSDLLHARWTSLGDVPLISVFDTPAYGVSGWIKRLEDLIAGSVILLLASVPMLIIAAAIRCTSGRPVLFRQRRYGMDGKEITVWKFRTMTVCEDGSEVVQVGRNDCRVTRLGAFLRRTSLDELPQFVNVIQGRMSIVGPRPHAVAHNEQYRTLIQGYMLRHRVRPGVTGWAQVNGWRGETDTLEKMQKRVDYDLEYIRNWSVLMDLRIIALSVVKGFVNRNAW